MKAGSWMGGGAWRGIGAALVAGLLLASAATRAAEPPPPVRIGVLADMGGTYADIGGMGAVEAVRMAVEDFGGRVLDRPVEVVHADGQNRADVAAGIARQWYDSGVLAITDLPSSAMALAVMTLATDKKRIALVTSAGSSDITGRSCSRYAAHWTWDTWAMSHGTAETVLRRGGKSWFFLTADYVFGRSLERDTMAVVRAGGGTVTGDALHPLGATDLSSQLLQAQTSGAQVLGLADGGTDMTNAVKQALEFGLPKGGMQPVALIAFISDIHSLGLASAQGLMLTSAFYWDLDDATRAWSQRFYARVHRMPSMTQAGAYSATLHYLRAMQKAGTTDADAVMAAMRALPINDFMTHDGHLREDGQVMRDMYLFQVKTPAESKGEWDLYKLVATIPAARAFRPLSDHACPLVH